MNSRRIRSNSVDTSDRISINAEAPPSEIAVNNDQAPFLEECYSPFSAKKGIAGSPLKDSFIEPRPRQSGLKRFAKIHYFLVPIELITFFYIFAMNFSTQITQQYFFQKVFAAALSEENCSSTYYCNVSLPGFCLKEGKIINETGVHVFIDGQKRVNEYSMGSTLIYVLPSLLMTILTGPLSDRFGRKPFLLFAVIGQVVSTIITLFITYYDLNVFIFYVASFFAGMLGGFGSMLSLSFSYVTDITPKAWLTIRMGLLEASIFLAVAASSGVVGLVVDNVKCDFRVPMWVLFSTSVAGLLFCIFMSESLSVETRASNSNKGFKVLVRGFKLLFWKSYLTKHLWEIWLIVIVMVVGFFTSAGTALILQYFLHNKPLEWNYTTIGFYQATSSASHLLILIVVLPFLVVVKVPEIAISFAGSVLACGSYVFIALLSKDWEMFLGKFNTSITTKCQSVEYDYYISSCSWNCLGFRSSRCARTKS